MSVIDDGLALVPYALGVHYDSQPDRRPALQRAVASGALPTGFGLEEGTAVLYAGADPVEFLTEIDGAAVHRVHREGAGVDEQRVDARLVR